MVRLSRAQVREIDRRAIERYLIPGIVLMENASRSAADVACGMISKVSSPHILILCGSGNNGGDGLAAARHLHNRGVNISLALTINPDDYRGDALANFRIIREMGIPIAAIEPTSIRSTKAALIIDAIFGTGLNRPPREPFGQIANGIKESGKPVLAIDVPSGLDCDTGAPMGACVEATSTITFVAEKIGFTNPAAAKYLGKIIVGDIGSPPELIDQVIVDTRE